ncbi:EAL domain-containing protein [Alteromonas sediminis]|uniref:EAL domain-containing protein n=1 Tax=Alteromonas sediminis TaxID=2259342 RepID=A0A3N5YL96_9ALTE|nr:EAL domain-containing protein [Alteromonas sediminis]RPJ65821.1 EAL domain-containing protein [Alteromonas sediminis]
MTESSPKKLSQVVVKDAFIVIVFALVALVSVFTLYSYNQAKDNLSNDLKTLANILGNRSVAALLFLDKRQAEANLKTAQYRKSVSISCIFDRDGRLFSEYSRHEITQCPESVNIDAETTRITTHYIEIEKPIIDADDTVGYILIRASKSRIQDTVANAFVFSALALALVVLVAFWVLRKKIGNVLKPLSSLHQTAEKMSLNPFSPERAKAFSNDEVGRLVNVFNSMLDNLSTENTALQESENRFRSLASNSPIGIYELDTKLNFVYTNDKWRELTHYPNIQHLSVYQKFIEEKGAELHASIVEKAKLTLESQLIEYEFRPKGLEGSRIFLEYVAPVFSPSGDKLFRGYIGSLMDISELKNAQLELEKLAFYDPLTKLPNRRFFLDHLALSLAEKQPESKHIGLLMIDIDNFKKVNDTLGHDAGDEMLRVVSKRLRKLVAEKDLVCRLGGDEFIILLKDIDQRVALQKISDRVLEVIRKPINIRGHDINGSASIGVSVFPEDGDDAHALMRNADLALYLSKDNGRNRVSFFSKKLEDIIHEKVRIENKLRKAISQGELSFHVQPKLSIAQNKLISVETLMRWYDPVEGMIPPDRFISVAEDTGLIVKMGDWLIETVFSTIRANLDDINKVGLKAFAINLSARQFYSSTLVDNIAGYLEKHAIPAQMIEFELTESSVIEDVELAIRIMQQLKDLGCKISIDDFGTGYSSLSYLKRLPIDAVKIDRSFISDIPQDQNDVEISAAIIAMGHNLGLEVVAEGVETEAQLRFLKEHQCEYAQGYYIAKPKPLSSLLEEAESINASFHPRPVATSVR